MDRELDRQTESGMAMRNMLARGQVVPLSMTLELLKDITNLTCSESLVLENCPMYVDQVEHIEEQFRIDRVFYISGTSSAIQTWKDKFVAGGGEAQDFDERVECLGPIVSHFGRLGKLERLDVSDTPKGPKLRKMVEQSTMPQFAIISSLSPANRAKQADMLASSCGASPAMTAQRLQEWAASSLKRAVDVSQPQQVFSALKQYADSAKRQLIVLDGYPTTPHEAAAFVEYFGPPQLAVSISFDEEFLTEEYKAAHEEEDIDEEKLAADLLEERAVSEATFKVFEEKCPGNTVSAAAVVEESAVMNHEAISKSVCERMKPRVYVILAPSGAANFSGSLAEAICTSSREGAPEKFTVVDAAELVKPGRHSAVIEEQLTKASIAGELPDGLSLALWSELFAEAFSNSGSPMGTFLLTGFPSRGALSPLRDQLHMLDSVCRLLGVIHVRLSDSALSQCCSKDEVAVAAYREFEEEVHDQTLVQLGSALMCSCRIEVASLDASISPVVEQFLTFAEAGKR